MFGVGLDANTFPPPAEAAGCLIRRSVASGICSVVSGLSLGEDGIGGISFSLNLLLCGEALAAAESTGKSGLWASIGE